MEYEKALPGELWQKILQNLPHADLCNVMRTSRHMNSLASWPDLWAGVKVNLGKVHKNGLAQLYCIERFKKIRKMDFSGMVFTSDEKERLLIDIVGSHLETLDMHKLDLSEVPADLLARAVSGLRDVDLSGSKLRTKQCIKLMKTILNSRTLINLYLWNVNLSQVPAELLARAVSRLQNVHLGSTCLTAHQSVQIFKESLSSKGLTHLNLIGNDLSEVPAELMAQAINRLQSVKLAYTGLTTSQSIKVLEASLSSKELVNLRLIGNDLSEVPGELLAKAVSSLQTVSLGGTRYLTTDHWVKLFEQSLSSKTLINLTIIDVDLSEVPADLLAKAFSRLQTLNICKTKLATDQCVKIQKESPSLKKLVDSNLSYHKLGLVCIHGAGFPICAFYKQYKPDRWRKIYIESVIITTCLLIILALLGFAVWLSWTCDSENGQQQAFMKMDIYVFLAGFKTGNEISMLREKSQKELLPPPCNKAGDSFNAFHY